MNSAKTSTIRKPFREHVHELRVRLTWSFLFLIVGGGIGYTLYDSLLVIVQKPLGQTLYYTSPTGGFNFVFKVSITFALVFALPVLSYHLFKFLGPLTRRESRLRTVSFMLWSVDLAYAGVLFGYFISLPAALHFLTRFAGQGIESLITAEEYYSFALAYIAGFAILFQLPLIVIFINRITPLKPSKMMKAQRWVILFSFIGAAILTPTPDPINQLIMALPIILLYQLSIVIVWLLNRRTKEQNNTKSSTPKAVLPQLNYPAVKQSTDAQNGQRQVMVSQAYMRGATKPRSFTRSAPVQRTAVNKPTTPPVRASLRRTGQKGFQRNNSFGRDKLILDISPM